MFTCNQHREYINQSIYIIQFLPSKKQMLIKLDFQEEDNHEIFVTREMNAKAMILFRRHMSDSMKSEFVAVSSPKIYVTPSKTVLTTRKPYGC